IQSECFGCPRKHAFCVRWSARRFDLSVWKRRCLSACRFYPVSAASCTEAFLFRFRNFLCDKQFSGEKKAGFCQIPPSGKTCFYPAVLPTGGGKNIVFYPLNQSLWPEDVH